MDKKCLNGHLPTARMLPPAEVDPVIDARVARKAAHIVIYCVSDTCRNSHQAAFHLIVRGFRHVAVYTGGKQDRVDAGLRLER